MRILVWQWGRRGAGPRYGAELAASLRGQPGVEAVLSLSRQAELLHSNDPPVCELPVSTYASMGGFLLRFGLAPFQVEALAERLRALQLDLAICAMPGPLDLLMASALRRTGLPFLVVVHDADLHPGDGLPFQMALQRSLMARAAGLIALSTHVADRLRSLAPGDTRPLLLSTHPPRAFGRPPPPPLAHGGRMRLLSFGRLLPYKGLDLLADALARLKRDDWELRVVGSGPESPELDALRALPNVTVENRWVPEWEIAGLLAWSDALVLSHKEASQSGGAAAAVAARRWVVATSVGGMTEQLEGEPLARMCAPTGAALAQAIAALLDERPTLLPPGGPGTYAVWRAMGAKLAADLTAVLPRLR